MVVHPGAGNPSGTLINGLVHKIEDGVGEPMRPGIVHLLDKDTSGLLVIAKTLRAFNCLKALCSRLTVLNGDTGQCWGEMPAQTIEKPLDVIQPKEFASLL